MIFKKLSKNKNSVDDLLEDYPQLSREHRHSGEGVICTSCDTKVAADSIVVESTYPLDPGGDVPINFCQKCADYIKDQFDPPSKIPPEESSKKRQEHLENNGEIIYCSYCQKDQFDVPQIFGVIRFYIINKKNKEFEIHPVSHENRFFAVYADDKPEKIGSVYICNECVYRNKGTLKEK